MDYTGLEIRGRQIRLVSIHPVPAGRDEDTWPVECTMTVRRHPLPTGPAGSNDADSSRSTHISFDHCVTEPPTESFVEELRQQLAPALWAAERRRGWASRVAGRIRKHVFGRRRERVLTISTDDITRLLSREAMVKIMADPARSGERRIWGPSVDIHRFEDAVGHTLLISDRKPQPHTGFLRPGDLNPFFRSWDPPHPTLLLDRLGEALHPTTYVALSYAWGPPEPTAEITVNGKTVAVRANLEAALRRLRKLEYFRFGGRIWIDSLCINQADEAEKQRQVAMMASVYSNAGNVVVWLGPEANDSDLVISYLEHVGTDYRAEYLEALDKSDPLTAATWRAVARARMEASYDSFRDCHLRRLRGRWWCAPVPVDLDDIALPLYRFFDRPYWRRLWIIQELCMGRPEMPVVCGGRVTQWRHIRDGVLRCLAILDILGEAMREALADRRQQPPPPAGGDAPAEREHSLFHVAQIAQLEIAGHRRALPRVSNEALPVIAPTVHEHGPLLGSALRRAVILASQSECSVPHDRIYGMLSIPGLPGLGVDIDYSKSVADVFTEFTAACVRHKSLDFLALLDGGPIVLTDERGNLRRETEKPTWVPDYGAKPERRIGIIDGDWNAGGYVPTSWCGARVVGQCLVLHGKVVDQVDGVGAISKADLESGATTFPGGNPLPGLSQPSNEANTKEREGGEDVLYRVLVGGCDVSGSKQIEAFESLYTAFPADEPPKTSSLYRNWHFLNSNADFLIHGRPLASYFTHLQHRTGSTGGGSSSSQGEAQIPAPDTRRPGAPPPAANDDHTRRRDRRDTDTSAAAARQAMEARTKMRRLVVTGSGLVGLAPAQTRPGDAVVAVVGHGKPVIARRAGVVDGDGDAAAGDGAWHLVGEAYVDGLMAAEKLPLSQKPWHHRETEAAMEDVREMAFV